MDTNPPPPTASDKLSDPTFRSYNSEQAKVYASQRLSYPELLYSAVLSHHSSTGGQLGLLLDVGCGPGNATRDMARSFEHALGVDPGEAMVVAAREQGGVTATGSEIRYVVSAAEELVAVQDGEVDLLISAMAVGDFSSSPLL